MTFTTILGICTIVSLVMSASFLAYVVAIIVPFVRDKPLPEGDPGPFFWHFVVPCRDEEAVIGGTVDYLRKTFPQAHVWVIDDDSDDATAALVLERARRDEGVHLIQRRRPEARTGKGDALNRAYRDLDAWMPGHVSRDRIVVCVVDADGRPSENLLRVCAGPDLYGDPRIAAVQVEVRMINRHDRSPLDSGRRVVSRHRAGGSRRRRRGPWQRGRNLVARTFVRMQDLEFRGPISAIQTARRHSRTVNIGGNGQLTRLSALDEIAGADKAPWRGSLLEDFELGLHLLLAGWRNGYTTAAWVDQEAPWNLARFLTQRARWAQGTMQCMRYLPRIWRSTKLGNLSVLEITYFLMQPWLQILGTLIYPLPILVFANNAFYYPEFMADYLRSGGAVAIALYLVVGTGEFTIWGFLYRSKCEAGATRRQALGWGLSFTAYVFFTYVIAWKAFGRLVTGRSGWAKTRRNAETRSIGAVALDA
ncbi:glycosyltransferase [Streptomyces sp. NPDC001262]|uniref:glycosyltransferase n=1 Tax=Streptomyces TaxID=1883 RepID=UPI0036792CF7